MDKIMIYWLNQATDKSVEEVGGKAASLAQMVKAGFEVPQAFIIPAMHYGIMTSDLEKEILTNFDALDSEYVAVRSSAIAEDGFDAAWAGQLETVLNVRRSDVVEAVKTCWDSLQSERAKSYAAEHDVDIDDQKVAVIVQAMIQSDVAGVAFSANPVTQNKNEMVIEAAFGLGEAVVSGQVTPDNYVVSKSPLKILDSHTSEQKEKLCLVDGKNVWVEMSAQNGSHKLTEQEILDLSAEVVKIEENSRFAVDVEWAYAGGRLYIMQSRPITTLDGENNTPLYKQGEVVFRWGPIPGKWFYIGDFVDAVFHHFKTIYRGGDIPKTQLLFKDGQVVWLSSDAEFRDFGKAIFQDMVKHPELHNDFKSYWANALKQLDSLKQRISFLQINTFEDCQSYAQQIYDGMVAFWIPTLFGEFANYGSDEVLRQELSKYITDKRELGKAMQVLTAPSEMSFMQKAEVGLLKTDDLQAYANKYQWLANGYGGVEKLDVHYFEKQKAELNPKLEENLQRIFDENKVQKQTYVKTYSLPEYVLTICDLIIAFIMQQDQRKEEMFKLQAYKEDFLNKVADFTESNVAELRNISLRELRTFVDEIDLNNAIRDRFESEFGFMCTNGSVEQLPQADFEHYWDKYSKDTIDEQVNSFSGVIASRGPSSRTTGKVAVVLDPFNPEGFEEGDIMVTTMTSPDYIDLMRQASAIVTDAGGLTSHAAILARELNVPCIVGTRVASSLLKTGDRIEVDTHGGIVRKVNGE